MNDVRIHPFKFEICKAETNIPHLRTKPWSPTRFHLTSVWLPRKPKKMETERTGQRLQDIKFSFLLHSPNNQKGPSNKIPTQNHYPNRIKSKNQQTETDKSNDRKLTAQREMAGHGTWSVQLFGQAENGFLTENSEKDGHETDIRFRV